MISIIIPVYNASATLSRCLDSVLAQTVTDWEAIVVNDCSTDDSADIIAAYQARDQRIRTLSHAINQGQATARNHAIEAAEGKYLAFLDADDSWADDMLSHCLQEIGDADVLQFAPRMYQYTTPWSMFISRDFVRSHGILFPEGMIYEDVIFAARLWQAAPKIVLSSYRGYRYTPTPSSTTARPHSTRRVRKMLREMGLGMMSFGALRLRLSAHFIKERLHYALNI